MSKKELLRRIKLAKKKLTKEYKRSKENTDKVVLELSLELDEMLNRLIKSV